MNILVITDDYMPNSVKISAKMMHELSQELINRGVNVTVITPDSNLKQKYTQEIFETVNVIRFKTGVIKNTAKVKRAINESLLSLKAWFYLKDYFKRNRFDAIIYYSPTIFWGYFISKLKRYYKNIPSYLILRDFFPQWIIDAGIIKKDSIFEKYFRFFEKISYDSADFIALQSPKNMEIFLKQYQKPEKLKLLYNWTKISNKNKKEIESYRDKLNLNNKVLYFYGGNIGHAQDMMNIMRVAKKMMIYSEAHFLLIGKGDEFDIVSKFIKDNNLTNTTLLPSVPQNVFDDILSEIDVGLFSLHKKHSTHNFPGKLLGYMNYSIPILGSVNSGNDLKELVDSYNAGLVSINGEDEIFFENAVKFLSKDLRKTIGFNSFKLLNEVFSVESAVNSILTCLKK
ncbi:glycosyltransferase family 4 protein [bacterium]|nr:glycosyltransferase family 4 protein [bacterium]